MEESSGKSLGSIDCLLLSVAFFLCAGGQPTATFVLAMVYLVVYKNEAGIRKFVGAILLALFPMWCNHLHSLFEEGVYSLPIDKTTDKINDAYQAVAAMGRGVTVVRLLVSAAALIVGIFFLVKSIRLRRAERGRH